MIGSLMGRVLLKTPTFSIVDVQGVGYEVAHTPFCAEKMGETVRLHIHTHVREDALQLFGFSSLDERGLFRELLRVSGIGPKMALSIMSGLPQEELVSSISQKDIARLQRIPGVGKKTAERILIDLSDRLKSLSLSGQDTSAASLPKDAELESVLLNLGYQRAEVLRAIKSVKARESEFSSHALESLVRLSLRELIQGKSL